MKVIKRVKFEGYEIDCVCCKAVLWARRDEIEITSKHVAYACPCCGAVRIIPRKNLKKIITYHDFEKKPTEKTVQDTIEAE